MYTGCTRSEKKRTLFPVLCVLLAAVLFRVLFVTTYVIRDGSRVYRFTRIASSAEAVLEGAGVELMAWDSYTTETRGATESITVSRAPCVTVQLRGKVMQVPTDAATVEQLLAKLGITLTEEDTLSCGLQDKVEDGMTVRIDRLTVREEISSAAEAYTVRRCSWAELPPGAEQVLIPGSEGELRRRWRVTYRNGQEVQRELLEETELAPARSALVAFSPAPAPEADSPVIRDGVIRLPGGEVLTYSAVGRVRATAYTHTDEGCNMTTATGTTVRRGTVAVDPRYIPYGTRMFIVTANGSYVYGICQAEDCGGAIKGDRVDLYMPSYEECMAFGRQDCTVYFLG